MSGVPATMRRPRDGRVLLGVCAAIARRLELDPTLVRVVTIIVAFVLTPLAIVAYAGLALVVPRDDGRALIGGQPGDRRETIIGSIAVALAAACVIATPAIGLGGGADGWEIGLLVIAVALIVWGMGRSEQRAKDPAAPPPAPAPASPPAPAPEAPAPAAGVERRASPAAAASPETTPTTPVTAVQPAPRSSTVAAAGRPRGSEPAPAREPSVFIPTAAAIVALIGLAAVVISVFGLDVTALAVTVAAGSAAVICGAVAIAFLDRRGAPALLAVGAVFAIAASAAAIGRDQFERGVGYREIRPASVEQLERGYDLGIGFMQIDLRDVELPGGETRMPVHVGWGGAEIIVPEGLEVVSVGDDSIDGEIATADSDRSSAAGEDDGAGTGRRGAKAAEPPVLAVDFEAAIGGSEVVRKSSGEGAG